MYVDDNSKKLVFHNKEPTEKFIDPRNSQHRNIKLTSEIEGDR